MKTANGSRRDCDSASPEGLETMTRALRHASRYHAWMFSLIEDFVGVRVLEVGAGSGNLTRFLARRSPVTALDISSEALELLTGRLDGVNVETIVADVADSAGVSELVGRGFDTIVSSNVLEHIENDETAIRNMREILAPTGGRVLLIVPAHPLLFGALDGAAGHHRRYSRSGLSSLLRDAGFTIVRARYVNLLGAIAWYVNGSILKTSDLNAGSVNAQAHVFDRLVVPVLRRVEGVISPPFGQSLVVVGQAQ
ncbi:MAG: class I SAM-dependent methyltransferase [Chloroflexi bacterium]|nr:class I SAM-dependent methyltransferase [Chloroflexota bacterium]